MEEGGVEVGHRNGGAKIAAQQADMDAKSGNEGDRLKHALVVETLQRAAEWPSLTYAETHGGAGVYDASRQPDKHYILDLFGMVAAQPDPEVPDAAGNGYLRILKSWWSDPARSGKYPGSPVIAKLCLAARRGNGNFELRATEKDRPTYERLDHEIGNGARHASFVDQIGWLTAPACLVLLVDPFACVCSFSHHTPPKTLDDGFIDLDVLDQLLDLCRAKTHAIVHLWTSFGNCLGKYREAVYAHLDAWSKAHGKATTRHFCDGSNHSSSLIGINEGAQAVRGLPMRREWRASWLSTTVYPQ